jgi:AbrB family looped-hinge helix DNA binding protein
MIEEIKKEIKSLPHYSEYMQNINGSHWNMDTVSTKGVFEILDKYKDKECDYKKYKHKIERGFDVNRRINIPKKTLDELDIKEDDTMILYVEDNKIILEKKE